MLSVENYFIDIDIMYKTTIIFRMDDKIFMSKISASNWKSARRGGFKVDDEKGPTWKSTQGGRS